MSAIIRGMGTAVPRHTMTQEQSAELAREILCRTEQHERVLTALWRRAGVNERRTVLPHEIARQWLPESPTGRPHDRPTTLGPTTGERMRYYAELAPPLAQEAARRALADARLAAEDISHLVTVSCTGFAAPGIDVAIVTGLGLPVTTERVQVGFMGCHGAINGLRAARALCAADPAARVLLCAVELCSLHYRFQWDPERLVANALFADGAAAAVIAGEDRTAKMPNAWRLAASGSCLIPDSQDAMSWRIGDHGFEMTLSASVPELIERNLRPWLATWLAEHGLTIGGVASWAIHPGGPRILAAIEESLGLPREASAVSRDVLSRFGNMSSPTVLFILQQLAERDAPRPCVALGFGPGLYAEAALLL